MDFASCDGREAVIQANGRWYVWQAAVADHLACYRHEGSYQEWLRVGERDAHPMFLHRK